MNIYSFYKTFQNFIIFYYDVACMVHRFICHLKLFSNYLRTFKRYLGKNMSLKTPKKKRRHLTTRNSMPSQNCVDWGNKTNYGGNMKNIEIFEFTYQRVVQAIIWWSMRLNPLTKRWKRHITLRQTQDYDVIEYYYNSTSDWAVRPV